MRVMADRLKYRAHLQKAIQTPNDDGGFDRTFETVLSFWCEMENESAYVKAIRGEQTADGITHVLRTRWIALKNLGKAFMDAFDASFDTIRDINGIKNNYFIFIQETNINRGRLFKIEGMARDEKFREWMRIQVHEEIEIGAGAVI